MKSVLVALSGLVAPGFAHGLMGQRKMMWIIFASAYLAAFAIVVTVWASWLVFAIVLGSIVHAGLVHRQLGQNVRWSWIDPLVGFVSVVVLNLVLRVFVIEAFKAPSTSMNPTLELGDHFFINKLTGAPNRGDIVVFQHPCEPDRDYVKRVIAIEGDTIEVRCTLVILNGKVVPRALVEDGATCRFDDFDDRSGSTHSVSCSRYREAIDDAVFGVFHEADQPTRDRAQTRTADSKDYPRDTLVRQCDNMRRPREGTPQPEARLVVTDPAPIDPCKPYMHLVVPPGAVFTLGDNRSNSNDSRGWGVVPTANIKGRVIGTWFPLGRFGKVR